MSDFFPWKFGPKAWVRITHGKIGSYRLPWSHWTGCACRGVGAGTQLVLRFPVRASWAHRVYQRACLLRVFSKRLRREQRSPRRGETTAGPERERRLLANEYSYSPSLWAILFLFFLNLGSYFPHHLQLKCDLILINNFKTIGTDPLCSWNNTLAMENNSQERTKSVFIASKQNFQWLNQISKDPYIYLEIWILRENILLTWECP